MMKLFSKNSNLCDHNSPTLQTDRWTDRQTTCDRNTALCTKVHRAVKTADFTHPSIVWRSRSGEPLRISGWNLPGKNQRNGATVWWKLHDPSFNHFEILVAKGRKSLILPTVILKTGLGVTQWYQWKARVHIPILVINSNFSPILHRFGDYGGLKFENRQFYLPHPHLTPPLWENPSEFRDETCSRKTRGMGLPYGENFRILTSTVFVWSTRVADGQTDGR